MTVAELGRRMSSHEFSSWMAYAQVEPFGEERADLRAAITSSLVANANRNPKKRSTPYKPEDFMPFREQPEQSNEPASPEDIRLKLLGLVGPKG